MSFEAAWLAGDLAESGFWSAESFERAAASVIESPDRRASLASWQRSAARDNFSLAGMLGRTVEMIAGSFETAENLVAVNDK